MLILCKELDLSDKIKSQDYRNSARLQNVKPTAFCGLAIAKEAQRGVSSSKIWKNHNAFAFWYRVILNKLIKIKCYDKTNHVAVLDGGTVVCVPTVARPRDTVIDLSNFPPARHKPRRDQPFYSILRPSALVLTPAQQASIKSDLGSAH